jgi:hypothetical protein
MVRVASDHEGSAAAGRSPQPTNRGSQSDRFKWLVARPAKRHIGARMRMSWAFPALKGRPKATQGSERPPLFSQTLEAQACEAEGVL